jgi:hypothetical protein
MPIRSTSQISRELQQLFTRKLLPHNNLACCTDTNKMEHRLAKIDSYCTNFHERPPLSPIIPEWAGGGPFH